MNPPQSARKFLKHNLPMLIEETGRICGGEGYKNAKELGKAIQSSMKLAENLRKRASTKP
jgi:hypothetical protein